MTRVLKGSVKRNIIGWMYSSSPRVSFPDVAEKTDVPPQLAAVYANVLCIIASDAYCHNMANPTFRFMKIMAPVT